MGLMLISPFGGCSFPDCWCLITEWHPHLVCLSLGLSLPTSATLYTCRSSLPPPTSQVPPCSGGAPIHLGPTRWALRRAVGAGIWSISWHRPYCCILPACWGTSADSGPGIPLDCSPQTLGQEVAVRRARQRLAVGMGAGKRKLCPGDTWQVGWRDRFWPCPLTLTS